MRRFKLTVLLCAVMILAFLVPLAVSSAAANEENSYIDSFDYASFDEMSKSGIWKLESSQKTDTTTPVLNNGAVCMTDKNSIAFNWTEFVPASRYSPEDVNVFEFDFKITDLGDGTYWSNEAHTGAVYVAMGGWYSLLRAPDQWGALNLGDTSKTLDQDTFLNKSIHVRIEWVGTSITTTLTDAAGAEIASRTRTNSGFAVMNDYTKDLVIRCEDGAVEIDNFSFSTTNTFSCDRTVLSCADNQESVFECKIKYTDGTDAGVAIGANEVFNISDSGMIICGGLVNGNYAAGTYSVTVYINNAQEMLLVEVKLPDGGIVRRGSYTMLGGSVAKTYSTKADAIKGVNVRYTDFTLNAYEIITTEPERSGFAANVYNLVTSFSDPESDRAFAWSAKTNYIGSDGMAVKYRVKGTEDWTVTEAVRESDVGSITGVAFFKADISDLVSDTEYEYKIGKTISSDEENDWSKTYAFKTAKPNLNEFTFVAIGDTQGNTWDGTDKDIKGFMYMKSALDEAFEDVESPAFILNTGDIVENGSDISQWEMYFNALGDYGAETAHFAAMGNHDNPLYFDLHFNHPNNGGTAAFDKELVDSMTISYAKTTVDYADETLYSYNYGNAHFLVINSGSSDTGVELLPAQRAWIQNDLAENSDAKWKIVMIHRPVYHRTSEIESSNSIYDIIEGLGVDLVIQGHSHLVTRTYPMKNGEIVTKNNPDNIVRGTGTVYITVGSTAVNHDSVGSPNLEECLTIITPENHQPSYSVFSIDDKKLSVTIKQVNGYVLDEFVIEEPTLSYSDGFDYNNFDEMAENGVWSLECVEKTDTVAPTFKDGVLCMTRKNSVSFDWSRLVGVSNYDANDKYVFEFDMKMTDKGDLVTGWENEYHVSALYVAFGGWYNQIRCVKEYDALWVGGKETKTDVLNKDLHVKIEWLGTKVTTTMTDLDGNVIISGTRTNADYTDMKKSNAAMTYLVLRCENGSVEIDNFDFEVVPAVSEDFKPKTSITLGSELVYNVYVPVSDILKSFTVDGNTYANAEIVTLDDGKQYYLVSVPMAASRAARNIVLKATITIDGKDYNGTWTMSIPKYAAKVIADGNSVEVQLVKDVLSYVRAAYAYFDETDAEAMAKIDTLLGNNYDANNAPAFNGSADVPTTGMNGVAFVLNATPAIRFYISDVNANYEFYVNGAKLATKEGSDANGMYLEMDVYAYAMCETITYKINGTESGSYHINSYYKFVTTDEEYKNDIELINLVERFAKYCESAKAYRNYVLSQASGN